MIRSLAFLIALTFAAPSLAEWRFVHYQNGYYVRTDGFRNDGNYYLRDSCGGYSNAGPYRQSEATSGTVKYGTGWEERIVNTLAKANDKKFFLQALRESGLGLDAGQSQQLGYQPNGYAMQSSGVTTIQQGYANGYAPTGNSVYGMAAGPSGFFQPNAGELLHRYNRTVERGGELQAQAGANLLANISQLSAGQVEVAKIAAAGQAMVEAMKAAQPPRVETHQWQSGTQQQYQSDDTPAAGATENAPRSQASAMAVVRGDVIVGARCAKCHSGPDPKKKLDLTVWKSLDLSQREALRKLVIDRVTSTDPEYRMPPPPAPPLKVEEQTALVSALSQ